MRRQLARSSHRRALRHSSLFRRDASAASLAALRLLFFGAVVVASAASARADARFVAGAFAAFLRRSATRSSSRLACSRASAARARGSARRARPPRARARPCARPGKPRGADSYPPRAPPRPAAVHPNSARARQSPRRLPPPTARWRRRCALCPRRCTARCAPRPRARRWGTPRPCLRSARRRKPSRSRACSPPSRARSRAATPPRQAARIRRRAGCTAATTACRTPPATCVSTSRR